MRTLARYGTTPAIAAFMLGTLAAGCGQGTSPTAPTSSQALASASAPNGNGNGPAAQTRQVDVVVSLSKNPAVAGDMVTVTAHATSRATGADVPSQPGELLIQACLDGATLTAYLPA